MQKPAWGLGLYYCLLGQAQTQAPVVASMPAPGLSFWEVAAQYGFPALLVVFLLLVWNKREENQVMRITAAETFIREQLLKYAVDNAAAQLKMAIALERFADVASNEQTVVTKLDETVQALIRVFSEHTCPFQSGSAQATARNLQA